MNNAINYERSATRNSHSIAQNIVAQKSRAITQSTTVQDYGYTLYETIGVGGYSKVKLGKFGEKSFAVKIISKTKAPQAYLDKFLPREIAALKRIRHPNIIELFDVIDLSDRVCIVTELAQGGDLLEYINQKGFIDEPASASLFAQVCYAMYFLISLLLNVTISSFFFFTGN